MQMCCRASSQHKRQLAPQGLPQRLQARQKVLSRRARSALQENVQAMQWMLSDLFLSAPIPRVMLRCRKSQQLLSARNSLPLCCAFD